MSPMSTIAILTHAGVRDSVHLQQLTARSRLTLGPRSTLASHRQKSYLRPGLIQVWAGKLAWPSTASAGGAVSEASARVRRWRGSATGAVWQKAMGESFTKPATMLMQ